MDQGDGPYAYSNNQWAGFDTPKSAENKADYILSENLGGAMFWEMSTDDFKVENVIFVVCISLKLTPFL